MATTVFAPITDTEASPSDNNTNGSGRGGPSGPNGSGRDTAEREPERSATLPGGYRLVAVIVMIWITALFGALTIVLESRWAHSPNWVSIRLPRILYVDAAILVLSSLSIEVARRSLQRGRGRRCIRGILVSLWMGFAFLVGQTFAWHELSLRGLRFNANPGSFFLYLVTGAHGLFVLGGMGLLSYVGFLIRRDTRTKWRAAMDSIALYWHFTDALWLYLVVLLFATIQR